MAVKPIPDGYHSVTPYLIVNNANRLLEFVQKAFGARVRLKMDNEHGGIGHAEVEIGDSVIMLADAGEQWSAMSSAIHLYVEDCDSVYQRALESGATPVQEMKDQFYGDRSGGVRDAMGNMWWISTHVEDVMPEEMERRAAEHQGQSGA